MIKLRSPSRLRLNSLVLIAISFSLSSCGKDSPPDHNSEPRRYIYEYGQTVRFGYGGDSFRFRLSGWSHIERLSTWTDGIGASMAFRVPSTDGPVKLRMKLAGFTKLPELPFQSVYVSVNAQKLGMWKVAEEKSYSIIIPKEFVSPPANEAEGGGLGETPLGFTNAGKTRLLIVDLHIPKASSPFDLDVNWDTRRLGIRCSELQITQTPERTAADAAEAVAKAVMADEDEVSSSETETARDRRYAYGTVVNFGARGGSERYKVSGWYTAEEQFSWTGKEPGVLELKVEPTGRDLDLKVKLGGMIKPGSLPAQPTDVYVNGEKIALWQVALPEEYDALIPARLLGESGTVTIQFRASRAVAPKAIGAGGDVRILGVRCEALMISELP